MKDKICLITGANSGIGLETAKSLCAKDAKVLLWCRSKDKARQALAKIKSEFPDAKADIIIADLSSQQEIRKTSADLLRQYGHLDVLINNAGSWFSEFKLTTEGIERQWAINHLAPFLLTHLMLPALRKSPDPRVITVSSDSHYYGNIHFDDVNLTHKYHGIRAYAQSKLANVLFTQEFEIRKGHLPITISAVQPGLVKTDIGLKNTISFHGLMWKIRRLGGVSPEKGAETSVYVASAAKAKGISGQYWDRCKPKQPSKKTQNQSDAAKLWELSMEMCGIQNYFGH